MAQTITLLLITLGVLLGLITVQTDRIGCPYGKEPGCGLCRPTCDNLKPTCNVPKKCVRGCVCKSGTVDNGLFECVEASKCGLCGNATYTTCTNPCPKGAFCIIGCIEGCLCKPKYVCLPDSNRCVLHQDLPKVDPTITPSTVCRIRKSQNVK
ncbi:serine protease inhibitor swm-1-like [Bufo bufo]|uniref:serine protease inhibitor swm-1-like n=1 Tax=Bufo bufo TaxID=8384 RepID=UPI001ABDBE4F|nr:serine protease inhibitor swm-1-like [Bufo bufo]